MMRPMTRYEPASKYFRIGFGHPCFSRFCQTVKDREGAVRKDKEVMEKDTRWIYNDYQKGMVEARRTGKPLLVVLRCVPCLACAGIDRRCSPGDGFGAAAR